MVLAGGRNNNLVEPWSPGAMAALSPAALDRQAALALGGKEPTARLTVTVQREKRPLTDRSELVVTFQLVDADNRPWGVVATGRSYTDAGHAVGAGNFLL